MAERRVHRLYSKEGDELYRVFRSYDNKEIVIVKHDREFDAADVIIEVCGDGPFNYVYATKGDRIDTYPTTGSYAWSNKRVIEFMKETIEGSWSGRYY